jgi:hypothetical protein
MKISWGKTFRLGPLKLRVGDRPWLKIGWWTIKPSRRR